MTSLTFLPWLRLGLGLPELAAAERAAWLDATDDLVTVGRAFAPADPLRTAVLWRDGTLVAALPAHNLGGGARRRDTHEKRRTRSQAITLPCCARPCGLLVQNDVEPVRAGRNAGDCAARCCT